jgi:hypothetical protein
MIYTDHSSADATDDTKVSRTLQYTGEARLQAPIAFFRSLRSHTDLHRNEGPTKHG